MKEIFKLEFEAFIPQASHSAELWFGYFIGKDAKANIRDENGLICSHRLPLIALAPQNDRNGQTNTIYRSGTLPNFRFSHRVKVHWL